MLNSVLFSLLIGLLLGFGAGLGIGGGSLLVMWLTLVIGVDHVTARAINLMFFIVCAASVSFFRLQKRSLSFKPLLPAIISGCIAAAICSFWGKNMDTQVLRKIFGLLLLLTGIRELLYRPRKAR